MLTMLALTLLATHVTLMEDAHLEAIRNAVSGAIVKTHIRELSLHHRVQATAGYHEAAELVRDRVTSYGLKDVRIVELPADGESLYHHFRAYYGWRAAVGRLHEVSPGHQRLGDFDEMKVALADYSQDADVTAELIDVGAGTSAENYRDKDVGGKIVLAGGALPAVHREAVEERGALGILSYYPNQHTGWSGDDEDIVRWGHLDPKNARNRFAFMTNLRTARALEARLAAGETIRLRAEVDARLVPANFEVVSATIPGTDLADEEIVFTCHLDHQSPGANDNASGAATILEVARVLSQLVQSGELPAPRRTIRFLWPPEIAGSYAYLDRHPDIRRRMKAGIHMDMVGGIPQTTKSVFFLSRPPTSIPSFVGDVGEVFFDYVVDGSRRAAAEGDFSDAIVSPEGTKEDFVAEIQGLDLGSDHQVFGDNTFGVPMLYFHDWPDIYIHTNKDLPENMDATKLQRVAFLGATTGYALANLGGDDIPALLAEISGRGAKRLGADRTRALEMLVTSSGEELHDAYREADNRLVHALARERASFGSVSAFTGELALDPWLETLDDLHRSDALAVRTLYETLCRKRGLTPLGSDLSKPTGAAACVPSRTETVQGPTAVYYYDYLADKLGEEASRVSLPGIVQYEILNFVDGHRTVQEIRDAVSAELDPVPLDAVTSYLELLARADVVRF